MISGYRGVINNADMIHITNFPQLRFPGCEKERGESKGSPLLRF